jgi:transcriptional regulator with XRE-family HTH domain
VLYLKWMHSKHSLSEITKMSIPDKNARLGEQKNMDPEWKKRAEDKFRHKLREARENAGFSQSRLATIMGIKQQSYQRIESKYGFPTLPTLALASKATGVDLERFLPSWAHDPKLHGRPMESKSNLKQAPEGSVGNRVKKRRLELGMTQTELGIKIELPQSYIYKIERHLQQPRPELVQKLAKALQCDPSFLDASLAIGTEDRPPITLVRSNRKKRWVGLEPADKKFVQKLADRVNITTTEIVSLVEKAADKNLVVIFRGDIAGPLDPMEN